MEWEDEITTNKVETRKPEPQRLSEEVIPIILFLRLFGHLLLKSGPPFAMSAPRRCGSFHINGALINGMQ